MNIKSLMKYADKHRSQIQRLQQGDSTAKVKLYF